MSLDAVSQPRRHRKPGADPHGHVRSRCIPIARWFGLALMVAVFIMMPREAVRAQELTGEIRSGGRPIPFAHVTIPGSGKGLVAGEDGRFVLRLPAAERVRVRVSAIGFRTVEQEFTAAAGERLHWSVDMVEQVITTEAVEVVGLARDRMRTESPVPTDVISGRFLQRTAASNLMDVIGRINGLDVQTACGVCGTNAIRINGMEGPYTAVLIDGMPLMGALASVYGLNGINPSIIDRLEIVKGPAGAEFGSEAMGGAIDVITLDPALAPVLRVGVTAAGTGEYSLDAAAAARGERSAGLAGVTSQLMDRFIDRNADGFTDIPMLRRIGGFGRWMTESPARKRFDVSVRGWYEDRFGGQRGWTRADRGRETVYGESIYTLRGEAVARWDLPIELPLRLSMAASTHEQNSVYGTTRFDARQTTLYSDVTLNLHPWQGSDLFVGVAARHDSYDDSTPATAEAERTFQPAVHMRWDVPLPGRLTALAGGRVDVHPEHGTIGTPRMAIRWELDDHTAVRVSGGAGFRVVRVFTEDHAALTGSRDVVIEERLRPERAWGLALSISHDADLLAAPFEVDLDAFLTRFSNRIIPDYDTDERLILYRNLDGVAESRGIAVSLAHAFPDWSLSWSAGWTVQDVAVSHGGVRTRDLFAPSQTGVVLATWQAPLKGVSVDYAGRVTGPMRLPAYDPPFERRTESPWFAVHTVTLTWRPMDALTMTASFDNITDVRQVDPLVDPGQPFGDRFDTSAVWGPLRGRTAILGVTWMFR